MAITSADIQLLQSQVLLDEENGGGAMTGTEVEDGVSNNLFPDISQLDRVYGRINLRKAFAAVRNEGAESYYGAHVVCDRPPADPLVSASLFTTRDWFDTRANAAGQVEAYLVPAGLVNGQLLYDHLAGQRSVTIHMPEDATPPAVGQTLYLVQDEGLSGEVSQYVRTTRVTSEVRAFTVLENGVYTTIQRLVATCEISDPLRYDFEGPEVSRLANQSARALVRETFVADAAQYFGIQPLAAPGVAGDMRVEAAGVFTQLVPSTRAETPITDRQANGERTIPADGSSEAVTETFYASIGPGLSLSLHCGIKAGTLSIAFGEYAITDDGGALMMGTTDVGTVSYEDGFLAFGSECPAYNTTVTASFVPAAFSVSNTHNVADLVSAENNGYVWQKTLRPYPAPGSVQVSYRSQDNWYTLRDQANGELRGSHPSHGVGTVDYATGTVSVTTGALPDVGSSVFFSWGAPTMSMTRAPLPGPKAYWEHTAVVDGGIAPGSLVLTWTVGGTAYTVVDDVAGGLVRQGTVTDYGRVDYATGLIRLEFPEELPMVGQTVHISAGKYAADDIKTAVFDNPLLPLNLTLPEAPVKPGSVSVTIVTTAVVTEGGKVRAQAAVNLSGRDDGAGNFIGVAGSIDYAYGTLVLDHAAEMRVCYSYLGTHLVLVVVGPDEARYENAAATGVACGQASTGLSPVSSVTVKYALASAGSSAVESDAAVSSLSLDLTDGYSERIVPGSVRFSLGGRTYADRDGHLLTDLDPGGSSVLAGGINYLSDVAALTLWTEDAAPACSIGSLATTVGDDPQASVSWFRIPVAPVRPGSVQIRGVSPELGEILATADTAGDLSGANIEGHVDYDSGVGWVRFGQWVTAAGNEGEWWYDAAAVLPDGTIFRPEPVIADTLRYNAVGYTYIPLSADILGIDPVRLPVDGRVPVFRTGDVVVVHNTQTTAFPLDPGIGYVLDCGRVRLESAFVEDAAGTKLPSDRYGVDLDAGTVTVLDPDLTGYVQPVRCVHRVEDMALVTDVQISGLLSLSRPLTHEYPEGTSHVSSALVIGDMQASVDTVFDQQTWTNVWSDSLIGSETTAEYNLALYPIEVTNMGAIEERWIAKFTSAIDFVIVGEHVGQIASGGTSADCQPTNPAAGAPYFVIRAGGWGEGWAAGNVLRFNTRGANAPVWIARTVLQGEPEYDDDSFRVQIRGDIDRP